jgi:hypothetical protein
MMAQVNTVEYGEVFGVYILGFKKRDAHMAEMMNEDWTVQSTQTRDAGKGFFRARSAPAPRLLPTSRTDAAVALQLPQVVIRPVQ